MSNSEDFGKWWNNEQYGTLWSNKNNAVKDTSDESENTDMWILDACSTIASYRNSYYDNIAEVYKSDYAKNVLLRQVLIMNTANEALKGAQHNLESLQRFHNDFRLRLNRVQEDILRMMERWWKLFIQEIEQNKLIASRYIAKLQTGTPYSLFSQFADRKHGQKICKEENNLLKEIAVAIDKYIL